MIVRLFLFTLVAGLVYGAVQQNFRMSANDPQIQIAEDIVAALESGQQVSSIIPSTKIDIARSLAPFVIVYDEVGKPIASTATLGGVVPTVPTGVFQYTKERGEDRITWEPQKNIRHAIVIQHFSGPQSGFVLAGRSLREVEKRERQLTLQVGLVWLLGIFVIFASPFIEKKLLRF